MCFCCFAPLKFTGTREYAQTQFPSRWFFLLLFLLLFSIEYNTCLRGLLYQASCTYAHTSTRRKTIAAKHQSKTHSRTIRIHTLHNFISDKTNGFCMREFISFYILAECVCVCVFARVYARQYQNRCCIFFFSALLSILHLLSLVLAAIAATDIILIHINIII